MPERTRVAGGAATRQITRAPGDQYTDASDYEQYMLPSEENGTTALQRAVYDDDMRAVKVFVTQQGRAVLKRTDKLMNTALHTACYFGKAEAAKFLMENGASTTATNFDGQNPLELAVMTGHDEVAQQLGDEVKQVKGLLIVRGGRWS